MVNKLKKGDRIAIVSLSSGILGEKFIEHEKILAEKRFKEFGLIPVYMENSLKGLDYISEHPEKRAEDLKQAFLDKSIKGIVSSIGGIDSYRVVPYLLEDKEFINAVKENPKLFLGFSDTTMTHITLEKLGLSTFYGQAYLTDFAELSNDMLPYTKEATRELFKSSQVREIISSPIWYEERRDYSASQVGKDLVSHRETDGHMFIKGDKRVRGALYGGCIEIISDLIDRDIDKAHHGDKFIESSVDLNNKYKIVKTKDELKGRILFLETSEQEPSPELYLKMLNAMDRYGMFESISGIIVGKPHNNRYLYDYNNVLVDFFKDKDITIVSNVNFGHSLPKNIIPYDRICTVDPISKKIIIDEPMLK